MVSAPLQLYSKSDNVLSTYLPPELSRCIGAVKVYSANAGQVRDVSGI